MGGTYGAYGREERCSQDFCGETLEKETTLNGRRRGQDNIKLDLQEIVWGVEVIDVAQGKDKFLVFVKAAVNLRVPLNAGNFLINRGTVSFISRSLAPWIHLG